ncbi:helix-turn-helix domain-containing protein [Flammeovirga yaeyamensis]|uniref:Helix-turn-helix domain-containing protein n=1 Tax=Flammeovirga yaeyamensis TaxID=367791 RepID=A0AAX1NAF1_9BACT|nr:helix-turn-helix domain-containing protein [Flammeovirga yaeyamensis]MBB3700079.1 excisionase family DNA binding protein [Flammeovirga yaeyamensis]NMF37487.1 helix-turn-helix domain-containing protein [Flammeovirga yaeyamensis]QWG04544.1 helix-turn-helix domain-containing protein [Flammeovirga yaeyamensis]
MKDRIQQLEYKVAELTYRLDQYERFDDELLTVKDVSKRLKMSLSLVYKLINSGEMKHKKVSKKYYVRLSDLKSFIKA